MVCKTLTLDCQFITTHLNFWISVGPPPDFLRVCWLFGHCRETCSFTFCGFLEIIRKKQAMRHKTYSKTQTDHPQENEHEPLRCKHEQLKITCYLVCRIQLQSFLIGFLSICESLQCKQDTTFSCITFHCCSKDQNFIKIKPAKIYKKSVSQFKKIEVASEKKTNYEDWGQRKKNFLKIPFTLKAGLKLY